MTDLPITPKPEPEALKPRLQLPKFVLITGGVSCDDLARALIARNRDHTLIRLRKWYAAPVTWEYEIADGLENTVSRALEASLGKMIFINSFLAAVADFSFGDQEDFIFSDAETFEAEPLIAKFGAPSVVTLVTGELKQEPRFGRIIWLPLGSTTERLKLLERELGTE